MSINKLYEFRISKYNHIYRKTGVFLKEEWTSISDIGKVFDGKKFTYSEYEHHENLYLSFIERACAQLGITKMVIRDLEDYNSISSYNNGTTISGINAILDVSRDCLREKYWCKLTAELCHIHFGYDYYLYLCSPLDFHSVNDLASKLGLYVELKESPYK